MVSMACGWACKSNCVIDGMVNEYFAARTTCFGQRRPSSVSLPTALVCSENSRNSSACVEMLVDYLMAARKSFIALAQGQTLRKMESPFRFQYFRLIFSHNFKFAIESSLTCVRVFRLIVPTNERKWKTMCLFCEMDWPLIGTRIQHADGIMERHSREFRKGDCLSLSRISGYMSDPD